MWLLPVLLNRTNKATKVLPFLTGVSDFVVKLVAAVVVIVAVVGIVVVEVVDGTVVVVATVVVRKVVVAKKVVVASVGVVVDVVLAAVVETGFVDEVVEASVFVVVDGGCGRELKLSGEVIRLARGDAEVGSCGQDMSTSLGLNRHFERLLGHRLRSSSRNLEEDEAENKIKNYNDKTQ